MTLPVNEIFSTVQGEGLMVGLPAVFIRLQGCPVGCPWCDTRHTWEVDAEQEVTAGDTVLKGSSDATWAPMTSDMLIKLLEQHRAGLVVITGGEPCIHDLTELTTMIHERSSKRAQIETSGTHSVRCHAATHVTVSPKIGMPGGFEILQDAMRRADEIKMPIGKPADILALNELLGRGWHKQGVPVSVQPISLSRKAMDLCVQNATANGWRVSVQTHALAGWR